MTASTGVFVSCEDYGDDIAHLQEQIDKNAETSSNVLAEKVATLESQLSTLKTAQEDLKGQLATAKAEAAAAANNALAAAQAAQAAADKAQGGADDAKAAAAAAQAAADAANKTLSEAVARVAVLETKVANLEGVIADLTAANKELTNKLSEVQTLANTLKNSTEVNASSIAKLGEQIASLNAEISKISANLGAKIDVIDTELNSIKANYATKNELEAKAAELAKADAELEAQIETNLNYIKVMQETLKEMAAKDEALAKLIEENYADVLDKIEALAAEQDAAEEEIEAIKAELANKANQTAVDKLAKELADAQTDILSLTKDLESYKEEIQGKLDGVNAKIDDIDGVVQELTGIVSSNWETVVKNQEDIYNIQGLLTDLSEVVASLTDQALTNWNAIVKNQESIHDHQVAIDDLLGIVEGLITQANGNWNAIVENQEAIGDIYAIIANVPALEATVDSLEQWSSDFKAEYDAFVESYEKKVEELESKLVDFGLVTTKISKRLTSISLVPRHYLRGVETIMFKTLKYTELGVSNPGTFYLTNETDNKAVYRMNPTGATVDCVDKAGAKFVANKASNTRAIVESPIEIANLAMDVDGDLVVDVKKTQGYEEKSFGTSDDNFYIVALSLSIKSDYLFETEESAVVQSEYVRLSEKTFTPQLHAATATSAAHLWGESLYNTDEEEEVYVRWAYDQDLDLTTLVRVCEDDANHTDCDFASYGLSLKFAIVDSYLQGSNQTDQQKFAYFVDEAKTTIASCVYDGGNLYAKNAAAINREPIVQVRLMHENRIVDEQYFKIKWEKNTPVDLGNIKQENKPFGCNGYSMIVDTREMNQIFYAHEKVNLSSNAFHAIYPDQNFTYEGVGSLELVPNVVNGVTSYNIKWNVTDADFKALYPVLLADQTLSVTGTWTSVDGRGDITFVLNMTVKKPEFGINGYNESYWNNGVFQMNPIVFGTEHAKSLVTINADLVSNGFNGMTTSPAAFLEDVITGTTVETAEIIFDEDACKRAAATWGYKSNQVKVTDGGKTLELGGEIAAKIVDDEDTGDQVLVLQESAEYGDAAYGAEGSEPTSAAIALVGTDIPVEITVDPCGDGNIYENIKNYSVNVTNPFDINSNFEDVFYETTVNGSRVDVSGALTMTDWNGYVVADVADASKSGEKYKYTQSLYNYYGISNIKWDIENAKTNIKNVNGNLVPTTNYAGEIWPDQASFEYDEVANQLVYKNNGATLGKEFVITCPVVVTYKWGECTANVKIVVKPGSSAQN